jgi:hypothetical protein
MQLHTCLKLSVSKPIGASRSVAAGMMDAAKVANLVLLMIDGSLGIPTPYLRTFQPC